MVTLCVYSFYRILYIHVYGRGTPISSVLSTVDQVYEPPCEKTGLQGFRPGLTQSGLYSFRK